MDEEGYNEKGSVPLYLIQENVKSWRVTQAAAAKRLNITQPRLNDLLRGHIDKFSLDALLNLAPLADVTVKVEVMQPAAKAKKTGGTKVQRQAA